MECQELRPGNDGNEAGKNVDPEPQTTVLEEGPGKVARPPRNNWKKKFSELQLQQIELEEKNSELEKRCQGLQRTLNQEQKRLAYLTTKYQYKVAKADKQSLDLQQKYKDECLEELAQFKSKCVDASNHIKRLCGEQVAKCKKDFAQQLEAVKQDHADRISKCKEEYAQHIALIKEVYEKRISEYKEQGAAGDQRCTESQPPNKREVVYCQPQQPDEGGVGHIAQCVEARERAAEAAPASEAEGRTEADEAPKTPPKCGNADTDKVVNKNPGSRLERELSRQTSETASAQTASAARKHHKLDKKQQPLPGPPQKRKEQLSQSHEGPNKLSRILLDDDIAHAPVRKVERKPPAAAAPSFRAAQPISTVKSLEDCTDVTDLAAFLSGPNNGKAIELQDSTFAAPTKSSPNASRYQHERIWPEKCRTMPSLMHLPSKRWREHDKQTEHTKLQSSVQLAIVSAPATTKVAGGRVHLWDSSVLLFDESCTDVNVKDLDVTGGVIVCYGKGCNINFEDCWFKHCTFVAAAGAIAKLHSCHFLRSQDAASVLANGAGTSVGMNATRICGGSYGVIVEHGARAFVRNLDAHEISGTAAVCRDKGSMLKLGKCQIEQCDQCVSVIEGSKCGVTDSVLADARCGLEVTGPGSSCKVKNTTLSNPREVGALVADAGRLVAEGCTSDSVHLDRVNTAYQVQSTKSTADIRECTVTGHSKGCFVRWAGSLMAHKLRIEGCSSRALEVTANSLADLSDCELGTVFNYGRGSHVCLKTCTLKAEPSAAGSACMYIKRSATSDLKQCTFLSNMKPAADAIEVHGGTLVADGMLIQDGFERGLSLQNGADATLNDCSILDCRSSGVFTKDGNTQVHMKACKVDRCQGSAVHVQGGASARLEVCTLASCTLDGLEVGGDYTDVSADRCCIQHNQRSGVYATGYRVVVKLKDSVLHGSGFIDTRTGPPVIPGSQVSHSKQASQATRQYADALAAELRVRGPMPFPDVKAAIPRPENATNLEKLVNQYHSFTSWYLQGQAYVSLTP